MPATNDAHSQSRDPSGYLLLYVFAGPVIGTLAMALVSMFSAGHFLPITQVPDLGLLALFIAVVFLPGWFFGFIPALLCALIMVVLRRYVRSDNLWLATTPFAGWLAVWLPLVLISGVKSPENLIASAGPALIGSVAAIGCQIIAWRRQVYPARVR